jgi:UDPglucose 6-dehydrogenase
MELKGFSWARLVFGASSVESSQLKTFANFASFCSEPSLLPSVERSLIQGPFWLRPWCAVIFCGYSFSASMKIVVLGLWHLGCVTAACTAKFESVIGLDFDSAVIGPLRNGKPPLFEPGLPELINEGFQTNRLSFSEDPLIACRNADLLWVCYDTPMDDDDVADLTPVNDGIGRCVPHLRAGTLILISSQVPVGTCRVLETRFPNHRFAYSPENLRLGKALSIFANADRVILGVRTESDARELEPLLTRFTRNLIVVGTESAEMIKHAINSFLANSIAFMNEIARICEQVGADANEVERGLKSEPRIGPGAYLSPGGPFAGGTLARDVVALTKIGQEKSEPLVLVPAIKLSNDQHKLWAIQKLQEELGELGGKSVAILGLTYKPGTDTLRRSLAVELCRELVKKGADARAYDPIVQKLPDELAGISFSRNLEEVVLGVDAAVVCTEWPQIREADWDEILAKTKNLIFIDANGFLAKNVGNRERVTYRQVGKPTSKVIGEK